MNIFAVKSDFMESFGGIGFELYIFLCIIVLQ